MRAYRWLVALVFMAGGLHAQTVGSLASSACPLGGCAQGGTGTVTTTSTLVSGRVALSSGASSLTDDAGCTVTGTGSSFFASFGGGVITPLYTSGPGKSGTNVAGANNTIQAEPGTGNATGSSIIFQTPTATTSGTDAQTQATRLTIGEGSIVPAVPIVSASFIYATNFRSYTGNNLDDIGQSGAKFKTGYFGTSVVTPVVQLTLATPTTSGDTCTAGTFWADANYLYVCTATNTIKRAALSAF